MWCELADANGLSLSTFESDDKLLRDTEDDPITRNIEIGFALGVTDRDINFNLKLREDRIENARCCVFAIRLKRVFETHEKLGAKALIKNQTFFGNDSGAKDSNNKPLPYICRAMWLSMFEPQALEMAQGLWEVFSKVVSRLPLVSEGQDLSKFLAKYIRTYPDIIAGFKRIPFSEPVMVRRGKSYIAERKAKAPEKPSASPLFTYGESKFLQKVLTPLFEQGSTYSKNWLRLVFDDGFAKTYGRVESLFNARWDCLTGYARVTTKRLVELRRVLQAPYIKKAEVPTTAPALLVANRRTPVRTFVQEISSVIPKHYEILVMEEGFGKKDTLFEDNALELLLRKEVSDLYGIPYEEKTVTNEELLARTPKILFTNLFSPLLDNPEGVAENINKVTALMNHEGDLSKEQLAERTNLLSTLAQINVTTNSGQLAQRRRKNQNRQNRGGTPG
jgi:hypothetical protein